MLQTVRIGHHEDATDDVGGHMDIDGLEHGHVGVECRAHGHGEIDAARLELHRPMLEASQLQDAAGESTQPHGLVSHHAEMLLVGRQDAVLHRFDGRLDRHERRPQLVSDVGGQTTLQLAIGLDRVGHVVKRLAEKPDLIGRVESCAGIMVAATQSLGGGGDVLYRPRDAARIDRAGERSEHDREDRCNREADRRAFSELHVPI